jgi:3'(2'), 5'-bisphosphate nucleotidase
MDPKSRDALALRFAQIASEAGAIVMASPRTATRKPDGSPVTAADRDAEKLTRTRLREFDATLPIIAEESFAGAFVQPSRRFVLVDPLDGTRDFVAGRSEFTINIALIEDGVPVAGCVYAPAQERLFLAGARAVRADMAPGAAISEASLRTIATRAYPAEGLSALASRMHIDAATQARLRQLGARSIDNIGSSLKFCLIAEGVADVYPRHAPTMEWDTAAGQAVLVAAGGSVIDLEGKPLRYGKPGFRNFGFEAWGGAPLIAPR